MPKTIQQPSTAIAWVSQFADHRRYLLVQDVQGYRRHEDAGEGERPGGPRGAESIGNHGQSNAERPGEQDPPEHEDGFRIGMPGVEHVFNGAVHVHLLVAGEHEQQPECHRAMQYREPVVDEQGAERCCSCLRQHEAAGVGREGNAETQRGEVQARVALQQGLSLRDSHPEHVVHEVEGHPESHQSDEQPRHLRIARMAPEAEGRQAETRCGKQFDGADMQVDA